MKSCKYFFLIILVFVISYSTKGFSAIWDYTISYEVTTDDFNASRQKAISINRYTALKAVIAKIISISDFKVIDKLISPENAYFFEDRLRIFNEQVVQDNYSVDITYYFNAAKITSFLRQNEIPYVTNNLENKILIIPIFNNSFSANNIWYNIFTNNVNKNKYLSKFFVLKDKDIGSEKDFWKNTNDNKNKISVLDILNNGEVNSNNRNISILDSGNSETNSLKNTSLFNNALLNKLKEQYNVNDVLIAKVTVEENNSNSNTKDSSANGSEQNNINTSEIFDPYSKTYYLALKGLKDEDFKEFPEGSIYDQLKNTIGFSEIYKKDKIIQVTEDKNFILFKVNFKSLIDWISIYSYIKQIDGIEKVVLSEIGSNYSIIKINYHGDLSKIIAKAALHNIIIDTSSNDITCKDFCY